MFILTLVDYLIRDSKILQFFIFIENTQTFRYVKLTQIYSSSSELVIVFQPKIWNV